MLSAADDIILNQHGAIEDNNIFSTNVNQTCYVSFNNKKVYVNLMIERKFVEYDSKYL